MRWKDWAGFYAVCSYESCHDAEYYAIRHSAGLLDVTPLFKYEVKGPDAAAFLSRVTVRNIAKLKPGRVTYLCWCDHEGKVVDDGTVTRLGEDRFRVTAAEPSWSWFQRFTRGYRVSIEDVTQAIGTLALQGPNARAILAQATAIDLSGLKFFGMAEGRLDGVPVTLTRTGYTGDLGYELWIARDDCLRVWDAVMDAGKSFGIMACGLDALDVARIEAGFVMNGVDYFSAHHCLIEARKSSPYELGLGWTVQLKRAPFNGQAALQQERRAPSQWVLRGLEVDWEDYEELCARYGLPPQVHPGAWRSGIPVYDSSGDQIGYATSGAWSPLLKKNLALATLKREFERPGSEVRLEATVEYHRHQVKAVVAETPFFNPERKRS